MSGLEKIILASLNSNAYEIEESKKSKGKSVLIDKIKVFKEYIKNVYTYKVKRGVEKLSDERLSSYIEYLNRENITVDKAIDEMHQLANNLFENSIELESMQELDKTQEKLDKLNDKKRDIEKELEEAESEKLAREAFVAMDQESEIELTEADAIPLEPINEEVEIETDVEASELVEQTSPEVSEIETPEIEFVPTVTEPIEEQLSVESEAVEEPVVSESNETVENTIRDEYIEAVDKIENDFREKFGRDFAGIVNAIMEETEKYANRQVTEITEVSKKAIDTANSNTKKALEEKAVVENDRDQYKTHYEQTLEVVKQKNEIIDTDKETIAAKDAEIEALKQELAKRDEIIADKDRNLEELNSTLAEKDIQLAKYKTTIEIIVGKDYTQSEVVEEPEVKTK